MSEKEEKEEKQEEAKKKPKRKKRVSLSTIIIILILIVGLSVLLYPTVSDFWNRLHESKAIARYDSVVSEMSQEEFDALWEEAEQYNKDLRNLSFPFSECTQISDEYNSVLDVSGNGIIGYVSIPSIGVELPIYHGTSETVLNKAVGHLEGTSLPIGEESTHAVLSAHRGLPSARLFTDLDNVDVGDRFTVTVLNKTFTYEVDQILVVEPTQLESLNVVEGEDYVTLMTCTPYGINTHRLLVRGHRIETENEEDVHVHADAFQVPAYIVIPVIGIPVLLLVLILMLIGSMGRSKYDGYDNEISLRDIREEERKAVEKAERKEKKKSKEP